MDGIKIMKRQIIDILSVTPGLTGREIAKKLKKDKKEVNSYLAKNSDGLVRRDWKWYIQAGNVQVLELPGGAWITAELFEGSFTQVGCIFSSTANSLIIRFPSH